MNTTQTVLLWYGGLTIVGVLLFTAMSKESAPYFIAAIVVLTGLGVVTFAPLCRVRKRWLLVWVLAPLLLGPAAFYGWNVYSERRAASLIRPDEIDVSEVLFQQYSFGARFEGRVKNRSRYELRKVRLEFSAAEDSGDVIDRGSTWILVTVPPGEARPFDNQSLPLREDVVIRLFDEKPKRPKVKIDMKVLELRGG